MLKATPLQEKLGSAGRESFLPFVMHGLHLLVRDRTFVGSCSLAVPTARVSCVMQPAHSRFSQENRKRASCKPGAGSGNAQEQFHLVAEGEARK